MKEKDRNDSTLLHYAVANNQTVMMNYLVVKLMADHAGKEILIQPDCETFDFKYMNCTHHVNPAPIKQTTTSSKNIHGHIDSLPTHTHHKQADIQHDVSPCRKQHSVPSMKVLQTMMKYKRVGLLRHPVVNAYLKMKWRNYCQRSSL